MKMSDISNNDIISNSQATSIQKQELEYYRKLAVQSGKKRVREIDLLARLNTELNETKDKLQYRVELDKKVAEISKRFLELSEDNPNYTIESALKILAEFYNVKHCFILEVNSDEQKVMINHAWCWDEFRSTLQPSVIHPQVCDRINEIFTDTDALSFQDIKSISDRVLHCLNSGFDTKTALMRPLFSDGIMCGFLGFEGFKSLIWNNEDIAFIGTISDIFNNAMERKRLAFVQEKLEEQIQIRQRIDSLGSLAGGVAHDLNNLLVSIIGNIDIVINYDSGIGEKYKNNLAKAYKSCQRAASLIKELQAFSKGTVSKNTTLDLYTIAKNVFDILDRTTHVFIEKKLCIKADSFFVHGSEDMLHQAFFNIGTNAIHAIEERGSRPDDYIRLSAEKYRISCADETGLPAGDYIHIIFEDNGIGMTESVKAKAFDPMFTTRRSSFKGQGLGLAMVYNTITQNHHGAISINSTVGHGSVFHLYLPAVENIEVPEENAEINSSGGSETILVVDDDQSVVDLIVEVLELYGYSVISAGDGEEGWQKYREHRADIDLVLLDLVMPKMSGGEVFDKIREITPDAKVILSSGHSENDLHQVMNVTGYLTKPYDLQKLTQTIRNALEHE